MADELFKLTTTTDGIAAEIHHADGLHSSVYRIRDHSSSTPKWTVVKRVGDHPPWKFQPHSVRREIGVLEKAKHVNIIAIQAWKVVENFEIVWEIHMPLIPLNLNALLDSPYFVSEAMRTHIPPLGQPLSTSPKAFEVSAKSVSYQVLSALAFLHGIKVAHRDVKPSNVLIDEHGCVKLVDFGVAWAPELGSTLSDDVHGVEDEYVEPAEKMCCAVATGPYRPPELLFSPRTYDAFAVDMWSFGALLAEFFTTLRFERERSYMDEDFDDADEEEEVDDGTGTAEAFSVPRYTGPLTAGSWHRDSLFDASRGEIGLAWSIFKVRGTPDEGNWPKFKELPDAESASFRMTPRIDLKSRLPHLPSTNSTRVLDLLELCLTYEPSDRITSHIALQHPWFTSDVDPPLLVPSSDQEGSSLAELIKPWADVEIGRLQEEDGRMTARSDGGGGLSADWDDLSD